MSAFEPPKKSCTEIACTIATATDCSCLASARSPR